MQKQLILNFTITALKEQQVEICKRKEFCKVRIFLPCSNNTQVPIQLSIAKVTAFLSSVFQYAVPWNTMLNRRNF